MNTQKLKIIAATLLLITTFASCKKGDTGAAGTNGTNGVDGNANVHASVLTVNPTDWAYDATNWRYYQNFNYPAITQDVFDNGTVAVFFSVPNGTYWQAMPYTYYYNSTTSFSFDYSTVVGGGTIFIDISNNNTFTFPAYTFKIVAIGGAQRKAHPNTDWQNYEQVKAALGNELVETTLTPATLKH